MDRHADLGGNIAVPAKGYDAFDEIRRLVRNRKRQPAQLRRCRVGFIERSTADQPVVDTCIRPVHDRRLNAVGPGVTIFRPRRGERGTGNLLGIKSERRPLRRVAADRQRAGDRLGNKMIAEAGLVLERPITARGFVFGFARPGGSFCLFHDLGHGTSQKKPRWHVAGDWYRTQLISTFHWLSARFWDRHSNSSKHRKALRAVLQSIFSIDVEDWFNLSGTGLEPPPSEWNQLESRVERNFRVLLGLLAEGGGASTCFFVGYFAKRFPHLVREAVAAGHEIASHSYFHRLVYELSPAEFYEDAVTTRKLLRRHFWQAGPRLPRSGIFRHRTNAVVFREAGRSRLSI